MFFGTSFCKWRTASSEEEELSLKNQTAPFQPEVRRKYSVLSPFASA